MEGEFSFTEEEVRAQLADLGYRHVSPGKLRHFMLDLQQLIDTEKHSKQTSYSEHYDDLPSPSPSSPSTASDYESDGQTLHRHSDKRGGYGRTQQPIVDITGKENQPYPSLQGKNSTKFGTLAPLTEHEKSNLSVADSSSSLLNSTAESQGRVKRKVARKRNGRTYVLDESTQDFSDASDITILEERLRSLPLRDHGRRHSDGGSSQSLRDTAAYQPLPAFIRPSTVNPHERGIKKCDPVNRYHQFKNEWDYFKPPGENRRSDLRWFIRGQMLSNEMPQRGMQQRPPSSYVVPISKKR